MSTVDQFQGLNEWVSVKSPCVAATVAAIQLSTLQTIDGIVLVSGDRVLVKDQADAIENGIYIASTGAWSRAPDFDSQRDVVLGTRVLVIGGTANGRRDFIIISSNPQPGVTAITFQDMITLSGLGALSALDVISNVDVAADAAIALSKLGALGGASRVLGSGAANATLAELTLGAGLAILDNVLYSTLVVPTQLPSSSIRQTILNAPVANTGLTNFLPASNGSLSVASQNVSSSAPFVVSAAGGVATGITGAVDRIGVSLTNVTWNNLSPAKAVSTLTRASTTATLTTAVAHGLQTGSWVNISGSTPAGYNGLYQITVTTSTAFTYVMQSDPGANTVLPTYTVINHLYVDVDGSGVLTTGASVRTPVYEYGDATTANVGTGQFTFSIPQMLARVGDGAAATQAYRVYVGEAECDLTTVVSTRAYNIRSRFRSAPAAVPVDATVTVFNHNVGVQPMRARVMLANVVAEHGYQPGEMVEVSEVGRVNRYRGFYVRPSAGTTLADANDGTDFTVNNTKWNYILEVDRGW